MTPTSEFVIGVSRTDMGRIGSGGTFEAIRGTSLRETLAATGRHDSFDLIQKRVPAPGWVSTRV